MWRWHRRPRRQQVFAGVYGHAVLGLNLDWGGFTTHLSSVIHQDQLQKKYTHFSANVYYTGYIDAKQMDRSGLRSSTKAIIARCLHMLLWQLLTLPTTWRYARALRLEMGGWCTSPQGNSMNRQSQLPEPQEINISEKVKDHCSSKTVEWKSCSAAWQDGAANLLEIFRRQGCWFDNSLWYPMPPPAHVLRSSLELYFACPWQQPSHNCPRLVVSSSIGLDESNFRSPQGLLLCVWDTFESLGLQERTLSGQPKVLQLGIGQST